MELTISFDMDLVVLVIRQGRIAAIESGRCIITGALAIAGSEVAKRQGRFDLLGEIPLGHGLVPAGPTGTALPTKRPIVSDPIVGERVPSRAAQFR